MRDVVAAERGGELVDLPDAVTGLPHLLEAHDVGGEPGEGRGDCRLPLRPRPEPPPQIP